MNLKTNFLKNSSEESRFYYEDFGTEMNIAAQINLLLPVEKQKPIAIICIGTDRSTGDSLGPLVGTYLEKKKSPTYYIYGTLEEPIHAVNLEEKLAEINRLHQDPFIIGIDACLGRLKSVGMISIGNGPLKPGAGVNKELPQVGDIHITGIVNVSGFMEFFVLQNTRLNLVMKMAKTISNGLYKGFLYRESRQQLLESHYHQKQLP